MISRHLWSQPFFKSEFITPAETVYVGEKTHVDTLVLENITTENHTEEPMPLLVNKGRMGNLILRDIKAGNQIFMTGTGVVERIN